VKKRFVIFAALILALQLGSRFARSAETTLGEFLQSSQGRAGLDAATLGAPERFNKITLVHLGVNSTPLRHELIRSAKNTLFMSIPYWFPDTNGLSMMNELKLNRENNPGLDARLFADWLTPAMSGDILGRRVFDRLSEITGGQVELWNKPWSQRTWSFNILKRRLHDKMLIVDGQKLLMGGMNMGDTYLLGGLTREGWHDTDVLIEGQTAQDAQRIYLKNWLLSKFFSGSGSFPGDTKNQIRVLHEIYYQNKSDLEYSAFNPGADGADRMGMIKYKLHLPIPEYERDEFYFPRLPEPDATMSSTRLIYDNPLVDREQTTGKNYSKVRRTLEFLFKNAQKRVRIFLPYLTITKEFELSLIALASRGIPVEVITNSAKSHDLKSGAYYAAFSHYPSLLAAGVTIYEWQGHLPLTDLENMDGCTIPVGSWPGQTLHTKMVIIDGEAVMMGSHNMNTRSETYNTEVMALIVDPRFAAQAEAIFENDLDKTDLRKVMCGDGEVDRPARVKAISLEQADKFYRLHGEDIRKYAQRQFVM